MEDYEKIELRSEKVRKIIGQIPPRLIRMGIGVLSIIIALMIVASYYIPYPESIRVKTTYLGKRHCVAVVPYTYIVNLKQDQSVYIGMDGYDKNRFGLLTGKIIQIDSLVHMVDGRSSFEVFFSLTHIPESIPLKNGMTGNAEIVYSEETVFNRIFQKVFN